MQVLYKKNIAERGSVGRSVGRPVAGRGRGVCVLCGVGSWETAAAAGKKMYKKQ